MTSLLISLFFINMENCVDYLSLIKFSHVFRVQQWAVSFGKEIAAMSARYSGAKLLQKVRDHTQIHRDTLAYTDTHKHTRTLLERHMNTCTCQKQLQTRKCFLRHLRHFIQTWDGEGEVVMVVVGI